MATAAGVRVGVIHHAMCSVLPLRYSATNIERCTILARINEKIKVKEYGFYIYLIFRRKRGNFEIIIILFSEISFKSGK